MERDTGFMWNIMNSRYFEKIENNINETRECSLKSE